MTDDQPEPLVIAELHAENVMRLRAVTIRPDPGSNVVVIGGRNAQGKTSVLRSIAVALGGAAAAKGLPNPIRDGADEANVTIDLGRFVVRRTWDLARRSSNLTVTSKDGGRYQRPQQFLDDFLGELTFDPLHFMRQPSKDQVATLLKLVDLPFDLDDLDDTHDENYTKRTEVNREVERLEGHIASLTPPAADTPAEEVSTEAILAEHRAAVADAEAARVARSRADQSHRDAERLRARLAEIDDELRRLQLARTETEAALAEAVEATGRHVEAANAIDVPDLDDIEARLAAVENTNATVRAANEYRAAVAALNAAKAESDDLTFLIEEARGAKRRAAARAAMPIAGLSFDLDTRQVLYNGVVLPQCSAAEQLQVSMAIGMAMNPTIRVMCITDGSLLDEDSMAAIETMAADRNYQVWIEVVSVDDPTTIIIEDGEVVERDEYEELRRDRSLPPESDDQ